MSPTNAARTPSATGQSDDTLQTGRTVKAQRTKKIKELRSLGANAVFKLCKEKGLEANYKDRGAKLDEYAEMLYDHGIEEQAKYKGQGETSQAAQTNRPGQVTSQRLDIWGRRTKWNEIGALSFTCYLNDLVELINP